MSFLFWSIIGHIFVLFCPPLVFCCHHFSHCVNSRIDICCVLEPRGWGLNKCTRVSHGYDLWLALKSIYLCITSFFSRLSEGLCCWWIQTVYLRGIYHKEFKWCSRQECVIVPRKQGLQLKICLNLQGDAGNYECHANNKWSVDMRSFRTDYNIFFD